MHSVFSTIKKSYIFKHKSIFVLFVLALIYTAFLIYPNYQYECADNACGLSMVDTYFHDAFWHIGIASTSFSTYPFRMPVFAGYNLQGYHYLYDLILSILGKSGLSYLFLYWRISPLLYLIIITILAIRFARKIHDSPQFVSLILFFVYFAGTFSFIANLIIRGSAFGYGVSSLMHTSTSVLYPTVAFSYCLLLAVFIVLLNKKLSFLNHVAIGALLFICMGLKFYAGISVLIFISVFEIASGINMWLHNRHKKNHHPLHILLTTVSVLVLYAVFTMLALIVFYEFPRSLSHESVFAFAPFASVHPIVEDQNIYGIKNLVLIRQTLYAHGVSPRLILLELITICLFLFHHFGTRLIGLFYLFWLIIKRKATAFDFASLAVVIITTILSMTLVQRGEQWWNSMQFLYYAVFVSAIYTARWLFDLYKSRRKLASVLIIIIIFLTIPNSIEKLSEMYKTKKRAVSYAELEALSHLQKLPDGVVFSVPLMPDTAYISAFTGKQTYFSDEQMLRNTGVAFEKRKAHLMKPEDVDLNYVKAQHVYMLKKDPLYRLFLRKAKENGYRKVFENKEVYVMSR